MQLGTKSGKTFYARSRISDHVVCDFKTELCGKKKMILCKRDTAEDPSEGC